MSSECDMRYMKAALAEANTALALGEIPVGAIVVHAGRIVGRGSNRRLAETMPFAHAEMLALAEAGEVLGRWRFDDCALYVTLEPCPMCAGAIVQTRVKKLVFGAADRKAGACGSLYDIVRDPRMAHRCTVRSGVLAGECADLLRRFFASRRKQR